MEAPEIDTPEEDEATRSMLSSLGLIESIDDEPTEGAMIALIVLSQKAMRDSGIDHEEILNMDAEEGFKWTFDNFDKVVDVCCGMDALIEKYQNEELEH